MYRDGWGAGLPLVLVLPQRSRYLFGAHSCPTPQDDTTQDPTGLVRDLRPLHDTSDVALRLELLLQRGDSRMELLLFVERYLRRGNGRLP